MSREQIESAFSQTLENILEVIGHCTAAHLNLIGDKALDVAVESVEEYLKLLKTLRDEIEKPITASSCMSPLLNDSMLVHRNRLSRSSKTRLRTLRDSPEGVRLDDSPMEVDRHNSFCHSQIGSIAEESTFLDATREMDESTGRNSEDNERGFLADVSDMNGTVRSRLPSFNFDSISPVSSGRSRRSILPINYSIDFDADTSAMTIASRATMGRCLAGEEDVSSTDATIILVDDDELHTPRPHHRNGPIRFDSEVTPTNLWNVKLRPGSNRKISEEIRREIQRQLANENE